MRILFLSHYFPPEVNAPANRTHEHCREWVREGHEVHVITCFPSHPHGRVFDGYRLRWYRHETIDGIQVHRVPTYIAANRGVVRRSLNYVSFFPAAVFRALRLGRFDWIIATSPQFMVAVAGRVLGALKRTPWVFELRDLWPDSVVAVGALKRSFVVRAFEQVELALYRNARMVVSVTRSFIENLEGRGISSEKLCYVPNGVDPDAWQGGDGRSIRAQLGIGDMDTVVSYVGTVGLAHGVGTLVEAAGELQRRGRAVHVLVAGDGAERETLERQARERGLESVHFLGLLPREEIPDVYAASDIAAVILVDRPVFRTVIPSKLLEAMAAGLPVVLGVRGEAERIVVEAGAGIAVEPENVTDFVSAIDRLTEDPERRRELGRSGQAHVEQHFSRRTWARRMLAELANRC